MVRIEDDGGVRLVTLARPEALNAFDTEQYSSLAGALVEADEHPHVAVVVLTGEGRAFSSGQDLAEMAKLGGEGGGSPVDGHGFRSLMEALGQLRKPLVAAVNGLAVGLGVTILGHCDVVMVSEEARLRAPFTSLGVVPEAGSSYLLPVAMGWQAAARFLFTSGWLGADEAVQYGLALRKVPAGRLLAEAMELAASIAAMPVVSLVATKELMVQCRREALERARSREDAEFARLAGAPANREAVAAFLEKRSPDFSELGGP